MEHETLPARRNTIFRDLAAAVLAVPVIASTLIASWLRRFGGRRIALALVALTVSGGVLVLGVGALAGAPSSPVVAVATPPAVDPSLAPPGANAAVTGFVANPTPAPSSATAPLDQAAGATSMPSPVLAAVTTSLVSGTTGDLPTVSASAAAAPKATATPNPTPKPAAPKVVRFRPRDKSTGVQPTAEVSVRFTTAMDKAATLKAFAVQVNGKVVTGKTRWAEGATVLVVTPAKPFPVGAKVTLTVSVGARSAAGVRLAKRVIGTFTVTKTVPKVTKIAVPATTSTWHAAELYMLDLLNCTRTGGWVSSNGTCTGAGTRNVAPLMLDAGISDKVSRPYAKILATTYQCSHYADGNPHQRLVRAGYSNWDWAENVGCPEINPIAGMLAVQRFFQSEKPYNGGHYRNLMNPVYDRCGIGVWVSNGHVRVVIDFYHP